MSEVDSRARENAKKAKQLPASVQYAIVQVLPNILNGAFWGFTDLNDIKNHYETLKGDKNITLRKFIQLWLYKQTTKSSMLLACQPYGV